MRKIITLAHTLTQKGILKIAKTDFVRQAIDEQADLCAFKEKPTLLVLTGVILIILSFLIGWPAVAALGVLAVHLHEPMILAIGGPTTYGLSHLVFIFGMYLSGGAYTLIFFRWLTRVSVERLLTWSDVQQAKSDLLK